MAVNVKISEEEKKRLEEIYGSVGDLINPETGYAAGVGFGNIQKLSRTAYGSSDGDLDRSSERGYIPARGEIAYGSSAADYIARLTDSMNAANALALRRKYDSMLRELEKSRANIGPEYYEARNRAATGNAQSARNYGEYAAARGFGTGAAAQNAMARESVYRANLGNLDRDEAKSYVDIESRRGQLKGSLASELAQALAESEGGKYQKLLEQYRLDETNAYKASRDAAEDSKWQSQFDYKLERDLLDDRRYQSEWEYKVGQAAKKASSSSAKTSSENDSDKTSKTGDDAGTAAFEAGFSEDYPEAIFLGEKGSAKPFANNTQKKNYQEALKIWERFYSIGFPAFTQTVNYLKDAKASRAVIKAVFDHLPGFAGLNAWYYAIEYGGLDREYYEGY